MKKSLFALAAVLMTSACSQAGLFIANIPPRFDGVSRHAGIVFSQAHGLKLDVYVPEAAEEKNLPVVIFFYGGRWSGGSKDQYRFAGSALAGKGYVAVIPDYRKYPDVKFPAFAEDGAAAVEWVAQNIGEYSGKPEVLFLSGHSAGAHTAAILATDETYLKNQGIDPQIIKAFAGLAGPYAFTPEAEDLKDIFGPPGQYAQMRTTTFIDGNEPPMLLLRGANDTTVGAFNAERLAEALKEYDIPVKIKNYADVDHVGIVAALTVFRRDKAPILENMNTFFREHTPE